jgi:hypothetical protein
MSRVLGQVWTETYLLGRNFVIHCLLFRGPTIFTGTAGRSRQPKWDSLEGLQRVLFLISDDWPQKFSAKAFIISIPERFAQDTATLFKLTPDVGLERSQDDGAKEFSYDAPYDLRISTGTKVFEIGSSLSPKFGYISEKRNGLFGFSW